MYGPPGRYSRLDRFQNNHTCAGACSSQQGIDTCVAIMNMDTNISTWLDGQFTYPVRVRGKIPGTSNSVHVQAKYSTLLCTICVLVAKGRQVIVTGVTL
jgi:hypothetical protein